MKRRAKRKRPENLRRDWPREGCNIGEPVAGNFLSRGSRQGAKQKIQHSLVAYAFDASAKDGLFGTGTAPEFVEYVNIPDFTDPVALDGAGDLGAEGMAFIKADDSPNGLPLLVVANEVSGTTTLFELVKVQEGN